MTHIIIFINIINHLIQFWKNYIFPFFKATSQLFIRFYVLDANNLALCVILFYDTLVGKINEIYSKIVCLNEV